MSDQYEKKYRKYKDKYLKLQEYAIQIGAVKQLEPGTFGKLTGLKFRAGPKGNIPVYGFEKTLEKVDSDKIEQLNNQIKVFKDDISKIREEKKILIKKKLI